MTGERDALLDHVSAMGRELAPGTIASLASDIAAGKAASGGTPRIRFLCERLTELWSSTPAITASELALALLAAQRAAGDVAREQSLSIVWTGPDTHVPVRRNDEALYEVIASAERTTAGHPLRPGQAGRGAGTAGVDPEPPAGGRTRPRPRRASRRRPPRPCSRARTCRPVPDRSPRRTPGTSSAASRCSATAAPSCWANTARRPAGSSISS